MGRLSFGRLVSGPSALSTHTGVDDEQGPPPGNPSGTLPDGREHVIKHFFHIAVHHKGDRECFHAPTIAGASPCKRWHARFSRDDIVRDRALLQSRPPVAAGFPLFVIRVGCIFLSSPLILNQDITEARLRFFTAIIRSANLYSIRGTISLSHTCITGMPQTQGRRALESNLSGIWVYSFVGR